MGLARRSTTMSFPKCAVVALVVVAAACAACSSSSTRLPACLPIPMPIPAFFLVSPSPGATGVPVNLSSITFAGYPLGKVSLTGGGKTIPLTLQPAPTPTPTPVNALPQSIATLSKPLSASTTYTANQSYTNSGNNCSPWTATVSAGSFTTQ
jgi:hypothetical protein